MSQPPGQKEATALRAELPELSPEYIAQMYPSHLRLVQAQVFFRHGERTPVKARLFEKREWPFCLRANYLHSEFMKAINQFVPREEAMPVPDSDQMKAKGRDTRYTKRTRTRKAGLEYEPAKWSVRLCPGSDANSAADSESIISEWNPKLCDIGQLSDMGLDSLARAGQFMRTLYVDKLGFLPREPQKASEWLYVRSTDYSRVLQSTYALLSSLYPTALPFNKEFLSMFPIHTRLHRNETMHGNFACYNFIKHYVNSDINEARKLKWINDVYLQTIQLESIGARSKKILDAVYFGSTFHPVYDELMSMAAHNIELPADISPGHIEALGRVAHHQWTGRISYLDGQRLGFGRLVNDLVQTMAQAAALPENASARPAIGPQRQGDVLLSPNGVREETEAEIPRVPKLALYGGHDITVAPLAIIMGSTSKDWLPFASMLTFELFKDTQTTPPLALANKQQHQKAEKLPRPYSVQENLDTSGYFVRVRLNDEVLRIPTCEPIQKHHPKMGPSMCTLAAFFEHLEPIVATEQEYKNECGEMPQFE
ncbi:hypothetical protein GGI25_006176 [Coemansia spiralis]|uniref:Acid phosphatase n=2 Tax=Coemansia TaxID=4863 RepID=A0A9W8KTZ5_9FUNG|nr:histidine phosphatase superfamily [Coemansia spiralis]KAJ1986948.1 hypothetical protein EDC05_006081 [Coemansia umbellata]KAJ2618964.1 hypothetical protein GGI26_006203 [Coemansia sp. RSA 1358]KAJ2669376.1 hypothetical protein GGI25_006176 [Coemansia spiralis]